MAKRVFVDEEEVFQALCDMLETQTNKKITELSDKEFKQTTKILRRLASEFTIVLNDEITCELNNLIKKEDLKNIIKGGGDGGKSNIQA